MYLLYTLLEYQGNTLKVLSDFWGPLLTYKAKEVINLLKVMGKWKITKESMLNLLSGATILDS